VSRIIMSLDDAVVADKLIVVDRDDANTAL
jgi:hypothetical protein